MKMTKYGLLDSLSNGHLTSKPNQGLNNLTQQNIPQMGGAEIFWEEPWQCRFGQWLPRFDS